MLHYLIGDLGHLFVITSFVTALVTAICYWRATTSSDLTTERGWIVNGRSGFLIHTTAVVGIFVALFVIIYKHYFEYHYAYAHSSLHLPGQYMVSCFWEGQEGSFLLWMFWQAVLGIILIFTQRTWEAPVMTLFALVQAFLASMILGIVIPGIDVKIGSSPFILLRDAMNDPIFRLQPDFIPKDGSGLNPLLQNYWMVIHPPTLFLGFALTLVPFSFCMAGLWKGKYTEWVKPAVPWTLLGGAVLGLGILMGGYWAYETLSFGGYWNWDPVENAVYIPWLILIASLHTLMAYKATKSALRLSVILVISVFILILYSTFLTRSGILGDASVHSFTDLGLSGQLLIYLLFFTLAAGVLVVRRWKDIPASQKEIATYSREFWIFLGATVLCLMGFQVLVPTSIPVYNKVLEIFGVDSNLAPPANQIEFYSKFQLWFAAAVAVVSGIGQQVWWGKLKLSEGILHGLRSVFTTKAGIPVLYYGLANVLLVSVWKVFELPYLFLLLAGIFIIYSSLKVIFQVTKTNFDISGGSIAHIGLGLVLVGILFSAGRSRIVSLNNTGLLYNRELGTEFNRDNLLLFVNEPRTMAGYDIEFRGERLEPRHKAGFVKRSDVVATRDPYKVVARRDIVFKDKKLFQAKDTFEVYPENTFYEIELRQGSKVAATLFPRVQINPAMGGILASPDISRGLTRDLYTHVSAPMNRESEPEWSKMEEVRVKIGQNFFVNDYVATLEQVERIETIEGVALEGEDVAVKATIRIAAEHESYIAEPIFLIKERSQVGRIAFETGELGVRMVLLNIHPESNEFTLGFNTRQKDWVIIKAMEKPYINVLWLGTGLMMVGFVTAMVRRFREGQEA